MKNKNEKFVPEAATNPSITTAESPDAEHREAPATIQDDHGDHPREVGAAEELHGIKFHPVTTCIPEIEGQDFVDLVRDIKEHGLIQPILVHPEDDSVIDGRARVRACREAGVEPRYQKLDGQGSLVERVFSLNLMRRHLTIRQRAALAVELQPMLEAPAAERKKATQAKRGAGKVGSVVSKLTPPEGKGRSREKAAKAFKVSAGSVATAKKIKDTNPELHARVRAGDMTLQQEENAIRRSEKTAIAERIRQEPQPLPHGPYRVIVADPAWKYDRDELRYPKRAEKSVTLRAPDMKGGDAGVPYAAYVHPSNADSGAYGGMSFVIFPADDAPCLVAMGIGTQGLAPDEAILGRPGHARKIQAICAWLNHRFGGGAQVAWAKQDPTRVDIDVPEAIQKAWSQYERALKRYGKVLYGIYRPMGDHASTIAALTAMLDVLFQERGYTPLKEFENDAQSVQSGWFEHLMPFMAPEDVVGLLNTRRYVVIQGPPGTGKTRMARQILAESYAGNGQTIQFHPNTTYEHFVGGLAPLQESAAGDGNIGFRFAPKPGFLIEAAARSSEDPTRNYLLHIDEINRADLGKILGEAIYLFEPDPESRARLAWRTISARLSSASCSFRITSTCSAR